MLLQKPSLVQRIIYRAGKLSRLVRGLYWRLSGKTYLWGIFGAIQDFRRQHPDSEAPWTFSDYTFGDFRKDTEAMFEWPGAPIKTLTKEEALERYPERKPE